MSTPTRRRWYDPAAAEAWLDTIPVTEVMSYATDPDALVAELDRCRALCPDVRTCGDLTRRLRFHHLAYRAAGEPCGPDLAGLLRWLETRA